ncbi:MAG TPA: amino acid transport protein [Polyangia bacterium]|nr:amino acid transport protein [Polyangia bacterium]
MMGFDMGWLLASLIVSSIGYILFNYGRKQRRAPQAVAGIAMLVYPYFVHNLLVMTGVTAGLSVLLWFAVYLGL